MLSYQILQSASPTICKIKPGNMFTVKKFQFDTKSSIEWKKLLSKQDIELEWFSTTNNVIMYFSYNKKWISEILKNKKIKKFLLEKNYPIHLDNKAIIEELFFRLKNSNTFPHEVGVFLGYPLEDVISFEKNQGKIANIVDFGNHIQIHQKLKNAAINTQIAVNFVHNGFVKDTVSLR